MICLTLIQVTSSSRCGWSISIIRSKITQHYAYYIFIIFCCGRFRIVMAVWGGQNMLLQNIKNKSLAECNSGTTQKLSLFWYQYRALFIIYNLTNNCTIISNTIITNNMLLYVSTFKMSSSGSSLCLAKTTYRFSGLSKMKFLKYKMINFNKMLIVRRNTLYNQHFMFICLFDSYEVYLIFNKVFL